MLTLFDPLPCFSPSALFVHDRCSCKSSWMLCWYWDWALRYVFLIIIETVKCYLFPTLDLLITTLICPRFQNHLRRIRFIYEVKMHIFVLSLSYMMTPHKSDCHIIGSCHTHMWMPKISTMLGDEYYVRWFLCVILRPFFLIMMYFISYTFLAFSISHIPCLLRWSLMNKGWCSIILIYAFWLTWSTIV